MSQIQDYIHANMFDFLSFKILCIIHSFILSFTYLSINLNCHSYLRLSIGVNVLEKPLPTAWIKLRATFPCPIILCTHLS